MSFSLSQNEIDEMLAEEAAKYNYTLEQMRLEWQAGILVEPALRDLMLIWGSN